jgi:hypothetical protein
MRPARKGLFIRSISHNCRVNLVSVRRKDVTGNTEHVDSDAALLTRIQKMSGLIRGLDDFRNIAIIH